MEFGPFFKVGDRVRLWTVYSNPCGVIRAVEQTDTKVKYEVFYQSYKDEPKTRFVDPEDITLVERAYHKCSCGASSVKGSRHLDYCHIFITTNY